MAELSLDDGIDRVFYDQFTQESGYQMAQHALAQLPVPTALFTASNFIAIGAFQALREAGLRVPQDLSIVTFDDLPVALIMEPFLTVMAQPAYLMGQRATELLLTRLAGEGPPQPQEIVLEAQMIIRQSTGPPPDLLS